MIVCPRCGIETPRFTVEQTRCLRCEREVAALIAADTERRSRVVWRPKIFTGRAAA